jgi:outer membrane biogenesis lipoprotein LolB
MVLLKSILLSSLIFLTACAVKFDPAEHSRMVDVRHRVHQAQIEQHCANPKIAMYTAENLDSDATWLLFYTQYIPNNDSAEKMATELKKTTADFAKRYRDTEKPPSKVFCELRLKNIATQIEIIQRTNARRPR